MFTLKAQIRKLLGKKTRTLRENGVIPAVIYGHGFRPQSIQITYHEFEKIYKQVGESSLIDLEIEEQKPIKALIYGIQYHPLTNAFQHIDFYKIKADEKITVEVELEFIGVPPAVKELGGVLVTNIDRLEIECLPKDLVHKIDVDISSLKNFGDLIRVRDLKIPENIKVLQDLENVVVSIERPLGEEAPEQAPEEKVEEVEVVSEEKKTEEEREGEEEKGKVKSKS